MKVKSAVILIIMLVIIGTGGAIAYYGIGENNVLGTEQIRLGLDLAGGVSITYEAETDNPTQNDMNTAVALIRKRLDFNNYTEADAYQEGTKRIHVEIPGVKDANQAVKDIGQTAQLRFVGISDEDTIQKAREASFAYKSIISAGVTDQELVDQANQLMDDFNKAIDEEDKGEEIISGTDIKTASKQYGALSSNAPAEYYVKLELNGEGKDKFAQGTEKYKGKIIAILLDNKIISAPTVSTVISDGVASITGMADSDEAEELAALISAGALPFPLQPIQSNGIGAKLGADALSTSLQAGLIGLCIVLLFMLVVYRMPGLAANLALLFYASFVLILLSAFKITLTLPGVAGIILTIGMAVDANIIIFSRIKEELAAGKTLRSAVDGGFHKALSAILDGNVTTLIAAVILYVLGTGPIKGFAQTLGLGILVSMFTALVITRILVKQFIGLGVKNPKLYGGK